MVFVFGMFSALASLLHEIQSQYFGNRGIFLYRAIQRMLTDGADETQSFSFTDGITGFFWRGIKLFSMPLVVVIFQLSRLMKNILGPNPSAIPPAGASKPGSPDLVAKFFASNLVRYMGKGDSKTPSYISKDTFVTALLEITGFKQYPRDAGELAQFKTAEGLPASVAGVMTSLVQESFSTPSEALGGEAIQAARERKFRELLATWYQDTMDRATGWYKRDVNQWLFWWGLLIALVFNVDTIRLFRHFMNDADTRQIVISQASHFDAKPAAEKAKLLPGTDSSHIPLDTLQARLMGMMNNEIKGFDTTHVFGWSVVKKTRADTAKLKAKRDSLDKLAGKKLALQLLLKNSYDSIQAALEFRSLVGDTMDQVALGAPAKTPPPRDTARENKAKKERSDTLASVWKKQRASLEAKAISEKQKMADSAKSASKVLDSLNAMEKAAKDIKGCACSWLPCIPGFLAKLWAGLPGMILTALAISFGAPFWFDLLTSLFKLRGGGGPRLTGVKPDEKKS